MEIIKKSLVSLSLLGLLASPLAAQAVSYGQNNTSENLGTNPTVNFCTRITNTKSDILAMLTKAEDNRGQVRLDILGKLQDRKTQNATKVQELRDGAKNNFEKVITELEAKATTPDQTAAVATFKTTVETAITTRKTAVDTAIATYQTALTTLVGNREDTIKTAAATFKTAVSTAITTAQTACAGTNPDAVAIRTAFMASLKSANDAFKASVQVKVNGTTNQQLEALIKTRNDAIKAANQTFKTTVQAARDTLKLAFPSA